MPIRPDALGVLQATSRTFFIPISRLPSPLLEAVASAYLSMRAIDEIEDHPRLDAPTKATLLRGVDELCQAVDGPIDERIFAPLMRPYERSLPEVTLRLGEWSRLAPAPIGPRILDATGTMASRMADWAADGWRIRSAADLDRYTFGVAGAVGLLLSDIWAWHDGTCTDRMHAVGFGRGLQAVNILRNRGEDLSRGVDFFPDGWSRDRMTAYARHHLDLADEYVKALPPGPALAFCNIPRVLAEATLDALARGEPKLDREAVHRLVFRATHDSPLRRARTGSER